MSDSNGTLTHEFDIHVFLLKLFILICGFSTMEKSSELLKPEKRRYIHTVRLRVTLLIGDALFLMERYLKLR